VRGGRGDKREREGEKQRGKEEKSGRTGRGRKRG